MTIDEAIKMMRKLPTCVQTMWAMADVWEEAEAIDKRCDYCDGLGIIDADGAACQCGACGGNQFVSNGNSLRAEALRLLAECGKTGTTSSVWGDSDTGTGYWTGSDRDIPEAILPQEWWNLTWPRGKTCDPVGQRILFMDSYARADWRVRMTLSQKTRRLAGKTRPTRFIAPEISSTA